MKGRILTKETITGFINHLHLEEKSATKSRDKATTGFYTGTEVRKVTSARTLEKSYQTVYASVS